MKGWPAVDPRSVQCLVLPAPLAAGKRRRRAERARAINPRGSRVDLFGGKAIKELIESAGKFFFRERGQREGKASRCSVSLRLGINWMPWVIFLFLNRSAGSGFELVPVEYLCTAVVEILSEV